MCGWYDRVGLVFFGVGFINFTDLEKNLMRYFLFDKLLGSGVLPVLAVVGMMGIAGEAQGFVKSGTKWSSSGDGRYRITYSYSNLFDESFAPGVNASEKRLAAELGFGMWARYAPLDFVEIEDVGPDPGIVGDGNYTVGEDHADIRIGYHAIDGNPDGPDVKAHAWYPSTFSTNGRAGDVHFDDGDEFTFLTDALPTSVDAAFPFLLIMTHEIGHALGLAHSDMTPAEQAVMDAGIQMFFDDALAADLMGDDIAGIQSIYGVGVGSVTPIPEPSGILLVLAGGVGFVGRRSRG